jgi:hypothetical protein
MLNKLALATTLLIGIRDHSVLTAHSFNLAPPICAARQFHECQSIRDVTLKRRTLYRSSLAKTADDRNQQPDEWLNRASKIREEIRELEQVAALSRQGKDIRSTTEQLSTNAVEYVDIADSMWTLSYRFASDPEESNERNDINSIVPRRLFGGKVTIKYRKDGYTDIISQESFGSAIDSCTLIKAWGWDIELSKDNESDSKMKDQEYLLFSIDVETPKIEKNMKRESTASPICNMERFYFQARKDTDPKSGIITLADGTVTVKRDVVQKSSRWALFSPAGILAQFRYVGDFVAKPVRMTGMS